VPKTKTGPVRKVTGAVAPRLLLVTPTPFVKILEPPDDSREASPVTVTAICRVNGQTVQVVLVDADDPPTEADVVVGVAIGLNNRITTNLNLTSGKNYVITVCLIQNGTVVASDSVNVTGQ
jgi:hypothetical protein